MRFSLLIPTNCRVTVTAEFKLRTGIDANCTASGADGNSTSGDRLRVYVHTNTGKAWQTGSANASLIDSETITGNGTDSIVVEGWSNRADEIVTFDVTYVAGGANCGASCGALPVELGHYDIQYNEGTGLVELSWSTLSEINNDQFIIQRSKDGAHWIDIGELTGAGNSQTARHYSFIDKTPESGLAYYRLKQIDFNGKYHLKEILFIATPLHDIRVYSDGQSLHFESDNPRGLGLIQILDINGKLLRTLDSSRLSNRTSLQGLGKGIKVLRIVENNSVVTKRVLISP